MRNDPLFDHILTQRFKKQREARIYRRLPMNLLSMIVDRLIDKTYIGSSTKS